MDNMIERPPSQSYPIIDEIIKKSILEDIILTDNNDNNNANEEIIINTGDIILFDRPCYLMKPIPCFICYSAKFTAASSYDHIGIVIECTTDSNPNYKMGELYLLEANIGGVTLHPLIDRLSRTKSKKIALRKLISSNNINNNNLFNIKNELWNLALSKVGREYDSSFITMSYALLQSYLSHGYNAKINRNNEIDKIIEILNSKTYTNQYLEALVQLRIKQLINEKKYIKMQINNNNNKSNDEMQKHFCSNLVADILTKLKIMNAKNRNSKLFIPADFSSDAYSKGFILSSKYSYTKNKIIKLKNIEYSKDIGTVKLINKNSIADNKTNSKSHKDDDINQLIIDQVKISLIQISPNNIFNHPPTKDMIKNINDKKLFSVLNKIGMIDDGSKQQQFHTDSKHYINDIINSKYIHEFSFILLLTLKKIR